MPGTATAPSACHAAECGCEQWQPSKDDPPVWRVRYRDQAQHTRSKTFTRKADAERWLAENETSKYRGGWVDPLAGRITVRNAHQILGQILTAAIEAGRITTNPATGVCLPRIIEREMAFLTAEQVSQLADAIAPPYGTLILFAGWTGLRPGELAALKVRRLDLLRGTCEVAESVSEVDGVLVWGPTKTYARRTIRLPRFLSDQLAAYLADRPHGPDDLVFSAPMGGPLREGKFMERFFRPAIEAANQRLLMEARRGQHAALLPERLRMHDLRHTAASLMIREGASIKAVQKTLAHKSAAVTLDRYGHLFPDELEQLAAQLDHAYAARAVS
jgi:integrase